MKKSSTRVLESTEIDLDVREEVIRRAVYEAMSELAQPDLSDQIVVTYWVHARHLTPAQVGSEISYHMTSGVRRPPTGSLLAECTGRVVDAVEFDESGRLGVVRVGFPLKMLLDADDNIHSTDILHITAGEGIFGLRENVDVKLCHIAMSDAVLGKFPGPAYGAQGVRRLAHFGDDIAFGTILKPCTGMTPEEEAEIVSGVAANPMFLLVKEDENYLPGVSFASLPERLKCALRGVREAAGKRGGRGIIYAPHISAPPNVLIDNVKMCMDAGVNGIMFSELFIGGATRMVRDMTAHLPDPPSIYAHNSGISARTRHIYREVLDMFCRLDGADFRQTAPATSAGIGLLRPFGTEWRECEKMLTGPLGGHPPTMTARAGGLDQGNIIINLLDVKEGAGADNYLFLAGSAINGIKNARGQYDPAVGSEAMRQALEVFRRGIFTEATEDHVTQLKAYADSSGMTELASALSQRYGLV